MKHVICKLLLAFLALTLASCKENYSQGEKVGNLIEFTKKGVVWETWEGSLNMTQTGMNTSGAPFYFSFDKDRNDQDSLIALMKQAQVEGGSSKSDIMRYGALSMYWVIVVRRITLWMM